LGGGVRSADTVAGGGPARRGFMAAGQCWGSLTGGRAARGGGGGRQKQDCKKKGERLGWKRWDQKIENQIGKLQGGEPCLQKGGRRKNCALKRSGQKRTPTGERSKRWELDWGGRGRRGDHPPGGTKMEKEGQSLSAQNPGGPVQLVETKR